VTANSSSIPSYLLTKLLLFSFAVWKSHLCLFELLSHQPHSACLNECTSEYFIVIFYLTQLIWLCVIGSEAVQVYVCMTWYGEYYSNAWQSDFSKWQSSLVNFHCQFLSSRHNTHPCYCILNFSNFCCSVFTFRSFLTLFWIFFTLFQMTFLPPPLGCHITTLCHNTENCDFNLQRCENIKFHIPYSVP
jgi:hypothetical protein